MGKLIEKYFRRDEDVVAKVRKHFDVSEDYIKQRIEHLRDWLKKQPHLPSDDSDEKLEGFLLRNKFRMEKTKLKIEAYYTLRGFNKDYLKDIDPLSKAMQNNRNCGFYQTTTKLTPNLERLVIYKDFGDDSLFNFGNMMLCLLCIQDLKISTDYCISDRLILDLGGFSAARFKTMDLTTFGKSYGMYEKAFSGRLQAIDIVNPPPFSAILLALMKTVMGKKLYEKITVHDNLESLHKNIPKDCLPEEFGGSLGPIKDMHEEFWKMLEEERETVLRYAKRVSDESRRIGEVPENCQFGVDGSFKKLNLD